MAFANGWTVSVQWGFGNYCENHSIGKLDFSSDHGLDFQSSNAEIAAWDRNGNWYRFTNDNVKGYRTPDEVADFITMIRNK